MSVEKTEDGFVVYNLYLGGIPANFSEEMLQKHFSRFGEVSSVIIRWNSEKTKRYALINFKDAKSAALALILKHQHIGLKHERQVVKKADSWWQPGFKMKIESDSLIMMLNDDCLLHIFSFLSISERIKISNMNQRFKQIFEISTIRNKTVNLSNLTVMEIGFICREFGHLIQKIDLVTKVIGSIMECRSINQYRAPNLITKYCSELRHLNFLNFSINKNAKFSLLRNLTKISLRRAGITDKVCFDLSKLENLQYLDVSGNLELTGKYLKDFPELTHLNLDGCTFMQEFNISEFCSSSRIIQKLKSLNIKTCCSSRNTFTKLASLENLECLVISSEADLSVIKDIKKLKHLIIYVGHDIRAFDSVCQKLTYCTNLETLFIVNEYRPYQLKITEKNIFSMTSIKKLGLLRFALDDEDMRKIAAMPELTHLNIADCELERTSDLSHLFEKSNKLQHVDIYGCFPFYDYVSYSKMIGAIRMKIKETGRTTHCTLYGIKYADTIENSSLLKVVRARSVFPGMKLRDDSDFKVYYEFKYHID